MTDYTTIRVTEDAKADAEATKREDETWNDYIRRCTENPPPTVEQVQTEDVQELINRIASEAGDDRIDDDELARSVAAKLDYAELAKKVADELETRRR